MAAPWQLARSLSRHVDVPYLFDMSLILVPLIRFGEYSPKEVHTWGLGVELHTQRRTEGRTERRTQTPMGQAAKSTKTAVFACGVQSRLHLAAAPTLAPRDLSSGTHLELPHARF
jgi:hypothetical protein